MRRPILTLRDGLRSSWAGHRQRQPEAGAQLAPKKIVRHQQYAPLVVPEAVAGGCIGWGVPFVDGKPMRHP